MRPLLVSMIALLITGCAELTSPPTFSDVVPMGLDTYMITKQDKFSTSGSAVKADLYRRANAFCESKGKQLMPVNERSKDGISGYATSVSSIPANAELQFRCLDSGDPELVRPTMQSVPGVQINTE
ncbi:hypothetical protein [Pseudomonas alkylphenolica]|uniref:hypothetical protein n=1 Tax=Pseudomonas alkylphenolica TaxID=237609 RepID=UPI0018D7195D|nr:hypothetical protein [Pseudomonas alkylphenolica]MBH3426179.1 hypothetical protein [Pseudomonas alkylphenolica]